MLGIPNKKYQAKMAENLGHQFVFLVKKMENRYQIFADLIKCTWKETGMAKDTMSNLFSRLYFYINANKKKGEYYTSTLERIDKY